MVKGGNMTGEEDLEGDCLDPSKCATFILEGAGCLRRNRVRSLFTVYNFCTVLGLDEHERSVVWAFP